MANDLEKQFCNIINELDYSAACSSRNIDDDLEEKFGKLKTFETQKEVVEQKNPVNILRDLRESKQPILYHTGRSFCTYNSKTNRYIENRDVLLENTGQLPKASSVLPDSQVHNDKGMNVKETNKMAKNRDHKQAVLGGVLKNLTPKVTDVNSNNNSKINEKLVPKENIPSISIPKGQHKYKSQNSLI